jgi:hypothetical protein
MRAPGVRSSLGTARKIRAWRVILVVGNMVAVLLLVIFAAVVYDRLTFDRFSPPVYSIWARPGKTWHHAQFFISPWYGFDMAINGRSIFNYSNDRGSSDARRQQNGRWNSQDRPQLVALYLEIPQGLNEYYWTFENNGKEDATNVSVKIATVDLNNHTPHTLLTAPLNVLPRLKQGKVYQVSTEPENDFTRFLLVCLTYSNDRGTAFVDPPQFYFTPFYVYTNRETRSEPVRVTALQYDQLSASFSCTNL